MKKRLGLTREGVPSLASKMGVKDPLTNRGKAKKDQSSTIGMPTSIQVGERMCRMARLLLLFKSSALQKARV